MKIYTSKYPRDDFERFRNDNERLSKSLSETESNYQQLYEKLTSPLLKDVPPEVMKVAKEKLPDVTFERAMKKANGEYEVIGKNKSGKVREIDIKPDGTVTEIE